MPESTLTLVRAGLAAVLLGCGGPGQSLVEPSTPPVDPYALPAADKAKLCVVRKSSADGTSIHLVRDNGALVGATRGGSHFCYLAEPGEHRVAIEGADAVSMAVDGGRIYYLHEDLAEVMGTVVAKPTWVENVEAKALIAETRYAVLAKAPADEPLVAVAPKTAR